MGDPFWASAPLYALRLVGALSRVAGASRAVDLECCQREEATKLLAKVPGSKEGRGKGLQMCTFVVAFGFFCSIENVYFLHVPRIFWSFLREKMLAVN